MRKCGLKFEAWGWPYEYISHFPCGSVDWNRTAEHYAECRKVTSLAEVWIEINATWVLVSTFPSLPLRKCGLKFRPYFFALKCTKSLPLRKCGLKFGNCWHEWCGYKSLPLRKCGLKLPCLTSLCSFFLSLPLRKCGLKSKASGISILSTAVTSLAEVWIEIRRNWHSGWKKEVTSLAEVWIEILNKNVTAPIAAGHFPCGSVDWNIFRLLSRYPSHSHFPCGSVDWNTEHIVLSCWLLKVTSLAEVWIEIRYNPGTYWIWLCHFPCGSVDWNHHIFYIGIAHVVTSLAEVWIEILYLLTNQCSILSLPLRKCGLKYGFLCIQWSNEQVTSLAEVWIEIWSSVKSRRVQGVTSLAEVWIEITLLRGWRNDERSLPLRKCGLKCPFETTLYGVTSHFPCGSVDWNGTLVDLHDCCHCHFPCGSVDWNSHKAGLHDHPDVISLAEVWIEISLLPPKT